MTSEKGSSGVMGQERGVLRGDVGGERGCLQMFDVREGEDCGPVGSVVMSWDVFVVLLLPLLVLILPDGGNTPEDVSYLPITHTHTHTHTHTTDPIITHQDTHTEKITTKHQHSITEQQIIS